MLPRLNIFLMVDATNALSSLTLTHTRLVLFYGCLPSHPVQTITAQLPLSGIRHSKHFGFGCPSHHHLTTCPPSSLPTYWKLSRAVDLGPAVSFMLQRIRQETGVDVNPSERIVCLPCDKPYAGGFTPELGSVILCQGNFWSKKHMEHTLTHELVHMYDHCKFDVDWNNLRHHACSEVSYSQTFSLTFLWNPLLLCSQFCYNFGGFGFTRTPASALSFFPRALRFLYTQLNVYIDHQTSH